MWLACARVSLTVPGAVNAANTDILLKLIAIVSRAKIERLRNGPRVLKRFSVSLRHQLPQRQQKWRRFFRESRFVTRVSSRLKRHSSRCNGSDRNSTTAKRSEISETL